MWIGDSFLFMWMDSSLEPPSRPREGAVVGELWMVHSGGFYELVKRRSLRPEELPPQLHWFRWQAYTTWLSGVFLLLVVYGLGERARLAALARRGGGGGARPAGGGLGGLRPCLPLAAGLPAAPARSGARVGVRGRGVRPHARVRGTRGVAPGRGDARDRHGRQRGAS